MEGSSTRRVKNIFLTGKPGVGKTTALRTALGLIGVRTGGFYTAEVRAGGARTGFSIVTLAGESRMMASKAFKGPHKVGSYGVDLDAIDTVAAGAIEHALEKSDVVVIDEIGKMELFSDKFRAAVLRVLDADKPVIGVIMEKSHPFADMIKARADVELIEVTVENRNSVPELLKNKLWLLR